MDYIGRSEVEIDQRKIDVYSLTEKGRNELNKITEWMKKIEKIANEGDNKKCQLI
jgi:DNA-binding PadR family transcriptional regulator